MRMLSDTRTLLVVNTVSLALCSKASLSLETKKGSACQQLPRVLSLSTTVKSAETVYNCQECVCEDGKKSITAKSAQPVYNRQECSACLQLSRMLCSLSTTAKSALQPVYNCQECLESRWTFYE